MSQKNTKAEILAELEQAKKRIAELETAQYDLMRGQGSNQPPARDSAPQEPEDRWQIALESIGDGVWDWNEQTQSMYFSRQLKSMLGYAEDEIRDSLEEWTTRVHPDDLAAAMERMEKHRRGQTPIYTSEHRIRCKDGSYKWILDTGKIISWTEDHRPLRAIGTHKDISALKASEEKLLESEERYHLLFQTMLQGVIFLDAEGRITNANCSAEEILGRTLEQMRGRFANDPTWRAIAEDGSSFPSQSYPGMVALQTGVPVRNVIMGVFNPLKQSVRWINIHAVPRFAKGETAPYQAFITFEDITEKKSMEDTVRDNEERFRSFIEQSTDGFMLADEQGILIEWNQGLSEITGFQSGQVLGARMWEIQHKMIPPERQSRLSVEHLEQVLGDMLRLGEAKYLRRPNEAEIQTPNGERKYIQQMSFPIRTSKGLRVGAVVRDISELKRMEFALRESETRFSKIFHASPIGVNLFQVSDGRSVDVNEAFLEMTGYAREELIGRNASELNLFVDLEARKNWMRELAQRGKVREQETKIRHRSGEIRDILASLEVIELNGEQIVLVVATDITKRKQAEQVIKESEERLERVMEGSQLGYWDWDIETGKVNRNARWAEMLGYTLEEIEFSVRQWTDLHHPDDRAIASKSIQEHLDGKTPAHRIEYRMRAKNGQYRWILDQAMIVKRDAQGRPLRMSGTHTDITERKEAEEELRRREELLSVMGHTAHIGGWELDIATGQGVWTEEVALIHDLDPETKPNKVMGISYYIGDSQARIAAAVQEAIEHGTSYDLELEILSAASKHKWVRTIGHAVMENGQVSRLRGSMQDITERKLAEAKLRESETRYRLISENSADVIWVMDPYAARFTYISPSVEKLRGYTPAEIMAQPMSAALTPESLETVTAGLREKLPAFIARGWGTESSVNEVDQPRKDGSIVHTEVTTTYLFNEQGKVEIVGVSRDITERKRAAEKLRNTTARLEEAQRIAQAGSWEWVAETDTPTWSRELCRILEIDPDGPAPSMAEQDTLYTPDSMVRMRAAVAHTMSTGEPYEIELERVRADGSRRWLLTRGERWFDQQGRLIGLRGTANDITALKLAFEQLRLSEERFRTMADFTYDLEYWIDENQNLLYISPSCERITGFNRERFLQNPSLLRQIVHPDDRALFDQHAGEEFRHEEAFSLDFRILTARGEEVWINHTCHSVHNEFGKSRGRRISDRDITERKRAEKELRASEENYRLLAEDLDERVKQRTAEVQDLYDNAPTGYHSLDVQGRFININQTELRWLGYAREKILGRHISNILTPASMETFGRNFPTFKTSGVLSDLEMDFVRKDGTTFSVLVNATAVYDAQGNYLLSRSTVSDNTEQKKAENALRYANVELGRAMRMKDEFLANMSHELRTPLNGVLGLSEALQMNTYGELNEKQTRAIKNIESSGRHLLSLINDILDLSKIEAGKLEVHIEPISAIEVCQSSLAFIKEPALKKGIALEFLPDPVVVTLLADMRRLKQILVNLLSNAVKFTLPGGKVSLSVQADIQRHRVDFAVIDTGIGIAEADLGRLFNPFTQVDSSLTRRHEGTGLGLALVKELTELHGGEVKVKSEFGRGSIFTVSIPWKPDAAAVELLAASDQIVSTPAPAQSAAPRREKILLAEDVELNLMTIGDFLNHQGYEMIYALNGREAIEKTIAHSPDLILMDIQMPDIDGLEAIRRLRSDPRFVHVPIIALTAMAMVGDRERCLAVGANDYISKPISLRALHEQIRGLLE